MTMKPYGVATTTKTHTGSWKIMCDPGKDATEAADFNTIIYLFLQPTGNLDYQSITIPKFTTTTNEGCPIRKYEIDTTITDGFSTSSDVVFSTDDGCLAEVTTGNIYNYAQVDNLCRKINIKSSALYSSVKKFKIKVTTGGILHDVAAGSPDHVTDSSIVSTFVICGPDSTILSSAVLASDNYYANQ